MIITMMPMMLLKMTRIRGMIIDANGIEKLINIKSTPKNYKMKCERYLNKSAFRTFFYFKQ